MPPKTQTIYTTDRPNRDFSWFSPRPSPPASPSPAPGGPRKPRPPPATPRRVHKTPSTMFSITPKPPRRGSTRPPRIVLQPPPDEQQPLPPTSTTKPGPWSDWFPTRDSPPRFWRARKLPNETWTYQHSPTPPRPPPPSRNSLVASFFFGLPIPSTPTPAADPSPPRPRPPPPPPPADESEDDTSSDHLRVTPQPRSSGTTFPNSSAVSTGKGKGSSLMSVLSAHYARGEEGGDDGGKLEVEGEVLGPNAGGKVDEGGRKRAGQGGQGGSMALFWMAGGGAGGAGRGREKGGEGKGGGGNAKRLDRKVKGDKEVRVDPKRRVKSWLGEVAACERPVVAEWDGEGLPIY